jgi:hypothetical protein
VLKVMKGIRLYRTKRGRKLAVSKLKRLGHNYFVGFLDVNEKFPFGLSFGTAHWVQPKQIHRKDC